MLFIVAILRIGEQACEAELAHLLAADLDAGRSLEPRALVLLLAPKATALPRDVAVAQPLAGQLRCSPGGKRRAAREIDIHVGSSMLTALRLPSFHKLWAEIATRADTEGWPAARFVAVPAEHELAERDMRRMRRVI